MASRMDRYSKSELVPTNSTSARSDRNKSLYKQIEDLDSYTNIEGVASIEHTIDLEKVKELLSSREAKNKDKKENNIQYDEKQIPEEEPRNYDIRDLLSKVKETDVNDKKKYRSLSSKQHEVLNELNEKNQKNKKLKDMNEEEFNEFVKTISNMKAISDEEDPDDVGLLDDLKSDTMVGDAASIKKIIEEEKDLTKEFDTMQLDKSFYTSSFSFTKKDFEELKDMNHKIAKGDKFIIVLLIVMIILIILGVVFFVMK